MRGDRWRVSKYSFKFCLLIIIPSWFIVIYYLQRIINQSDICYFRFSLAIELEMSLTFRIIVKPEKLNKTLNIFKRLRDFIMFYLSNLNSNAVQIYIIYHYYLKE